jgi:hypothetical protein
VCVRRTRWMPRWAWWITSARASEVEVGQLHGLQARPQALHRVQVGRVGGQPLDHQPMALCAARRAWPCCGGRAARPTAASPSPRQGSVAAPQGLRSGCRCRTCPRGRGRPARATTADAVADRGGHRGLLPVERVGQRRRLAPGRPGRAHIGGQAERALVEEDQAGSAPVGVCLIRGQSSATQQSKHAKIADRLLNQQHHAHLAAGRTTP